MIVKNLTEVMLVGVEVLILKFVYEDIMIR